jgi:hypothetical protein
LFPNTNGRYPGSLLGSNLYLKGQALYFSKLVVLILIVSNHSSNGVAINGSMIYVY